MKVLHFVILLCVLAFPLRAFAAAPDLPALLFVLLTSGSMFGIWGVLLGIPVYASAKVVISAIFEWYKVVSGLYELEGEEVKSEQ